MILPRWGVIVKQTIFILLRGTGRIKWLQGLLALGLSGLTLNSAVGAQPQATVEVAWADEPDRTASAAQVQGRTWTDPNCGNCHKIGAAFSHPVGVAPSIKLPADLPLADGRMTCATCHDNTSADLHAQARQRHDGLLRGPGRGTQFCVRCHEPSQATRASMHAGMLGQAHLRWPERTARASGVAARPADGDSRLCLSCHDGTIARSVGGASGNPGAVVADSHPVGVVYQTNPIYAGKIDRAISFTPAVQLDARIRLVDGQVACASCHSLYSAEPGRLVMSNLGSNLCLSCHVGVR
jgi:predicted CXXCH cytochrome family protein